MSLPLAPLALASLLVLATAPGAWAQLGEEPPRPPELAPERPRPPQAAPTRPRPPQGGWGLQRPPQEPRALAAWITDGFPRLRGEGFLPGGEEGPWLEAVQASVLALRAQPEAPFLWRLGALRALRNAAPLTEELHHALLLELTADHLGTVRQARGPGVAGAMLEELRQEVGRSLPEASLAELVGLAGQLSPMGPVLVRHEAEARATALPYPARRARLVALRAFGLVGRLRCEALLPALAAQEAEALRWQAPSPEAQRDRLAYLFALGDLRAWP